MGRRAYAAATLLLALAAALIVGGCAGDDDDPRRAPSGLPVIDLRAPGGSLLVEVASAAGERARGLSGRDTLADGAGMLFDLGETRRATFVMRDMRFALDMVWIDADRRVAGVTANVPPPPADDTDPSPTYPSPGEVRYVLEVAGGVAGDLGIAEGAMLEFTLP